MAKRKLPEDYHKLAKGRGFEWLGPEVARVKDLTRWRCAKGHIWEAAYHNIYSGTDCPRCAVQARADGLRYKCEEYCQLAEEYGLEWVGIETRTIYNRTGWRCPKGHEWEATYKSIKNGAGCPECKGRAPKTEVDYRTLAKKRGLRWLGPMVSSTEEKTWWQCRSDHKWEAKYANIRGGKGCPACAENAQIVPDDYHLLAESRGFRWLGPSVQMTRDKTWWECEEGHKWEATYARIGYDKSGCPVCAGTRRKEGGDYHLLAESRGFRWLGPSVQMTRDKTWWECEEGHKWEATYSNVQQGSGCPDCGESRGEACVAKLLACLNIPFQRQRRFRRCRSKLMLPFDFFFTLYGRHFLVEYDGIQHFEPVDFFGGEAAFGQRQLCDKIKDRFAKEYGYVLIRIPYTVNDISAYLINALVETTGKPYEEIVFHRQKYQKRPTIDLDRSRPVGIQLPLIDTGRVNK